MAGKFPSIPASKSRDPSVEKLREAMEQGTGQRKNNQLDRWVTVRDLQDAGLARLNRIGFLTPGDALGAEPSTYVGPLTNLEAVGTFKSIILTWDGTDQAAYSYTEIWRADSDNLAEAQLVATSRAPVIPIPTNDYREYWFWVRAVSTSDNPGAFNASAGVSAQTTPDYETIRDVLTATQWQASTAYGLFDSVVPTGNVKIEGNAIRLLAMAAGTTGATEPNWAAQITSIGQYVSDGGVTWEVVEAGRVPFFIDPASGLVVIEGTAIRSASIDNAQILRLAADKIFAVNATIAEVLIGAAHITDAMVERLRADKLYVTIGTLATAIIGTGHITNAMIGGTIQSSSFSTFSETGWRILKSGAANFYDVVISRPNIVASGIWINPYEGSSSTSLAAFHWSSGQNIDGFGSDAATDSVLAAKIDSGYSETQDIRNIHGASFIVKARALESHIYESNSGSIPSTGKWFDVEVPAEVVISCPHYSSGSGGLAGGDIFILLYIALRNIHSELNRDAVSIRIDRIEWALARIT